MKKTALVFAATLFLFGPLAASRPPDDPGNEPAVLAGIRGTRPGRIKTVLLRRDPEPHGVIPNGTDNLARRQWPDIANGSALDRSDVELRMTRI